MDWTGRRVLVTGGAGFLGSNLCLALAARGARVIALDGFLFGGGANPKNLDGSDVEQVRGDIREIDLRPLCEGADGHLQPGGADQPHGRPERPARRYRGERGGAGAADPGGARGGAGCHRGARLHAAVLRQGAKLPVDENQPVAPPDANGVSKFAGEQYWLLEHRVRARPVVSPAADQLLRPAAAHS